MKNQIDNENILLRTLLSVFYEGIIYTTRLEPNWVEVTLHDYIMNKLKEINLETPNYNPFCEEYHRKYYPKKSMDVIEEFLQELLKEKQTISKMKEKNNVSKSN